MIFQDDWLFPHLSVAANIRFGLKGWRRDEADARLAEVAALCGVERLLDRSPETLSGGERQRVGLARALAPRPRLLLCDEPVSALDLANRHAMFDRLRDVQRAEAIPMLYVTHSAGRGHRAGLAAVPAGARAESSPRGRRWTSSPRPRRIGDGSIPFEGVRNVFPARVEDHAPEQDASRLRLDDGPELIVPFLDRPAGHAGCWSRSAPTTSCSPAIPSPASPPATRSPAPSSGSSPTAPRPRPSSAPAA